MTEEVVKVVCGGCGVEQEPVSVQPDTDDIDGQIAAEEIARAQAVHDGWTYDSLTTEWDCPDCQAEDEGTVL